jgi:uncharacterized protein (UPF0335 family)
MRIVACCLGVGADLLDSFRHVRIVPSGLMKMSTITAIRAPVRHPLVDFVEQIEDMQAQIACLTHDIEDIYTQAAGFGYDTDALRALVAERDRDRKDLAIADRLELYRQVVA